MPQPFRFTTSMPALDRSPAQWRADVRRIEDLGFSSVAISDHLGGGWAMDPIVAMTVAAEATSRLRLLAMVFCNDLRHPAILHRSMANLDVFSGGRVEIGLGAGWMRADYDAIGRPFDPPGVRISRLAEAIDVLTALFGAEPVTYTGAHYQVTDLLGRPRTPQRPRPPLVVGGGGRRVLDLAGRTADIVGINPRLGPSVPRGRAVAELSADRLGAKIGWARAAARDAGRDPDALTFQLSVLDIRMTHEGTTHHVTSSLAAQASAEDLAGSPAVLHGSLAECVDQLVELRDRFGISYLHLGSNPEAVAPIVARLTDT